MSNSSSNTQLVNTITNVFLTWMQQDIIPVCVTTIDICIIIVGVILNIILMVTIKEKGLMNEASTYFVWHLGIVDFIAYGLGLLPTIITAIAGKWILSEPVCQIHGAVLSLLMFTNFIFLSVLAIERGVKLWKRHLRESVFEVRKYCQIIATCVWTISGLLGFLPVIGVADIRYEFYHQGCMLDYEASPVFLLINFMLTAVASTIIFCVSFGCIFHVRRLALRENRKVSSKRSQKRKIKPPGGARDHLPVIHGNEQGEKNASFKLETSLRTPLRNNTKKPTEPPSGLSMMFEIFSDDQEHPAFHLAITYISLWACILFCYVPYFVLAFYSTFNNGGLWSGFYTVTLLVTHLSFVVKPCIYLGHNRHYQSVTRETLPEVVKKKVWSVRSSISGLADKVEDFVFKSPANAGNSFGNVIVTHKAVLIWKTRMKMKQQHQANVAKKETEVISPKTNISERSMKTKELESLKKPERIENFQTEADIGTQPTTPSSINITTSSFIENERQKLVANMKASRPSLYNVTGTVGTSSRLSVPVTSISPHLNSCSNDVLPGMIDTRDVHGNCSTSVTPVYRLQSDQLRLI